MGGREEVHSLQGGKDVDKVPSATVSCVFGQGLTKLRFLFL